MVRQQFLFISHLSQKTIIGSIYMDISKTKNRNHEIERNFSGPFWYELQVYNLCWNKRVDERGISSTLVRLRPWTNIFFRFEVWRIHLVIRKSKQRKCVENQFIDNIQKNKNIKKRELNIRTLFSPHTLTLSSMYSWSSYLGGVRQNFLFFNRKSQKTLERFRIST